MAGVCLQSPSSCSPDSKMLENGSIPHEIGMGKKLCQIDRLDHVSSWLRNNTGFTGIVGHPSGRTSCVYFPQSSYAKWSAALNPMDSHWMGIVTVKKATESDMIVPGPDYSGMVFVERPTFTGYVAWGCDDNKERNRQGSYCKTASGSGKKVSGSKVLYIGDVICQKGTPIPDDAYNELMGLSQNEFPDVCKIDGTVLNACESESLPQPIDVAWMDVGHKTKVVMREHGTKWVQEASDKNFLCHKDNSVPCSSTEEQECYGGKCLGDHLFCNQVGCARTEQSETEKCFCEYLSKPGEIIVKYSGLSVRPTCYGFSRMMATFMVSVEGQSSTTCTGCQLECLPGGVRLVTLVSELESATVCASHFCSSASGGKKSTEILFHSGALSGRNKVMVHGSLKDGSRFEMEGLCDFPEGCESLECTFCYEFLKNPQCYPLKKWVFIFVVTLLMYAAIMFITNICMAVKFWLGWVVTPIKVMVVVVKRVCRALCGHATRIREKSKELLAEEGRREEEVQLIEGKTIRRGGNVRHYLFSVIMVLCVCQAFSCDELVQAESKMITCKDGQDGTKDCSVTGRAYLPVVNPGQVACLHLTTPGSPDSKCFKIKVDSINLKCKQSSSYYVPEAKARCTSVRRCRWAGDCESGCPSYFSENSFSDDWANRVDRAGLGISGCSDGCGGAACGCFNAAPSCIFWRKWVENPNGEVWKVSPCTTWVLAAKITIQLPNGENKTMFPMSGIPTSLHKGVSITYLGGSTSYTGLLSLCEVYNMKDKTLALAPCNTAGLAVMGNLGEIQCKSMESARTIKRESCTWNSDLVGMELRVDDAVCYSRITSTMAVANFSKLPATISGLRFEQSPHEPGRVIGSPLDVTAVSGSFSVSFRGMKLKLVETAATCTGEALNLTGCYSCMTGAKASIKLHSNKETTAHVKCLSDSTAFTVNQGVNTYTVPLSFDKAVIDENCELNCGGHASEIKIKGELVFKDIPKFVEGSYTQTFHSSVGGGVSLPNPGDWMNALFGGSWTRWILGIIGFLIAALILFSILVKVIKSLLGRVVGHKKET
ncbi:membrane glycoprotein [Zwiesel bat bandavirus]|uniref:Envelopment polyprotein n=2 Tax=Zwiesel bat bandavirus TaxID=3071326 RepID=A0A6C0MD04_9VIRU|nr:membrane glycoprotein [Zwiesel bat bandavirus]QHU78995.1 membrane glycoprotein [Zwiesel bat bandavirus]